jgi:6-pyruvoyltetrahydropterin/6-carboxytetrahydropterin synthase
MKFCAAHRLHSPQLSDEENAEIYGICNNVAGHGHNYILEVTIEGEPDPRTGMILNLKDLADFLELEVVGKLDHKHLNHDVPFLEGVVPTTEMLASRIWDVIEGKLPVGRLTKVKVWESENNIATRRA